MMGSIVVMGLLEPSGKMIGYLRINFCMAILPFGLGVLSARHWCSRWLPFDSILKTVLYCFVAFLCLTICKLNFYLWLFMPLFIVVIGILLVKLFIRICSITSIFVWLGGLSGGLFVVHPILRQILLARANESGHCYAVFFIYLFLTIILSYMLKPVFTNKK